MVVGLYKINSISPGLDAGILKGDIIIKINNNNVETISDMVKEINNDDDKKNIKITYLRSKVIKNTNLKLIKNNNLYKTGLYVKDSVNGVGTLTYIDPNTKLYGALGHQISESNSKKRVNAFSGSIFKSEVTSIDKSSRGNPGEKNAKFFRNVEYGNVNENTNYGIFGNYSSTISMKNLVKVGLKKDIKKGKAFIRTVINKNTVEEFEINITNLNFNSKTKNILFEVVDKKLLEKTGGIIQGMSGSPIIQNNKLIGAVTHVIVNNTKKGYGIFIETMLKEGEN